MVDIKYNIICSVKINDRFSLPRLEIFVPFYGAESYYLLCICYLPNIDEYLYIDDIQLSKLVKTVISTSLPLYKYIYIFMII